MKKGSRHTLGAIEKNRAAHLGRALTAEHRKAIGNGHRGKPKSQAAREALIVHGHTLNGKTSATYNTWTQARARCTRPTAAGYANYGGRGVRVDPRWLGADGGFVNFLADMGERPSRAYELHRIEGGTSNYEPGNCEWSKRPHPPDRQRSVSLGDVERALWPKGRG